MSPQLRGGWLAVLLAALGVTAGCLNPRPEDFPSEKTDPDQASGAGNGGSGGTMGRDPRDPLVPSMEPPGEGNAPGNDDGDPSVNEPVSPGDGADAGAIIDAGAPDSGALDAD